MSTARWSPREGAHRSHDRGRARAQGRRREVRRHERAPAARDADARRAAAALAAAGGLQRRAVRAAGHDGDRGTLDRSRAGHADRRADRRPRARRRGSTAARTGCCATRTPRTCRKRPTRSASRRPWSRASTASRRGIAKIVGISDDLERVAKAEADARAKFGDHVSAARSQPYYLDVTHPEANKGAVLRHFSREYDVPLEQDRDARRPAQRHADVQGRGAEHRDGQRRRGSPARGDQGHRVQRRRGLRAGDRAVRARPRPISHWVVGLRRLRPEGTRTDRRRAGSAPPTPARARSIPRAGGGNPAGRHPQSRGGGVPDGGQGAREKRQAGRGMPELA